MNVLEFYVDDRSVIGLTEFYIQEALDLGNRITLQGLADSSCISIILLRKQDDDVFGFASTLIEAELEQEFYAENSERALSELVNDFGWKRM